MAPTIESALRQRLAESQILDFKSGLYADAKEWLKDVTAFANATGGRILIGVTEDADGVILDTPGVTSDLGADQEIQRLQNWLRSGTEPDVTPSVRVHSERDGQGRLFFVVDIQESPSAPHRVTVKSAEVGRQVYLRKGRDSLPATMAEIGDLFMGTQRTTRLVQEFAHRRIQELRVTAPIMLARRSALIFHVCPHRGYGDRELVEWALANPDAAIGGRGVTWETVRPNLLGAISVGTAREDADCYVQAFYNGCLELLFSNVVFEPLEHVDDRRIAVPAAWLQQYVYRQLRSATERAALVTGCDRYELFTTIRGVNGIKLVWHKPERYERQSKAAPWIDTFALPTTTLRLSSEGMVSAEDLSNLTDLIWRAWGEPKCQLPAL